MGCLDRKSSVYSKYKLKSWADKVRLAKACIKEGGLSESEVDALRFHLVDLPNKSSIVVQNDEYFKARYGMLTYNDKRWNYNRPNWPKQLSVDELVECCRADTAMINGLTQSKKPSTT